MRELKGHSRRVLALAFSPDGGLLASGGSDGSFYLWHPASGSRVWREKFDFPFVYDLAFAPDGSVLALANGRLGL
ncbi:MAG: WD40 repeat domain-containing protein, partial [Isosphaeraceae bacterium]